MLNAIARKLAVGVTLAALFTPIAFASPIGTDPIPRVTMSGIVTPIAFASPIGTDPIPRVTIRVIVSPLGLA